MIEADVAFNWVAIIALLAWPGVALWLYSTRPVTQATLWTILGGYLLLPVGVSIKLSAGVPPLDKSSVPALAALAGSIFIAGRRLRFWNEFGLPEAILLVFLFSPLITSELNTDPVMSGGVLLPGVGAYDGLSAVVGQLIFVTPFLLGRQLFKDNVDFEQILRTLVIAGLFYSLPMLFEIRMSPQLNYWLYGYYPSEFVQQMRDGGFRPMVFIGHGLGVAFFTMTSAVAATALWRTQIRVLTVPSAGITAYLLVVLILCKSLGSLIYCGFLMPLVRFVRPRLQLKVATILVGISLAYPLLRGADLVPTSSMVEIAQSLSPARAVSLQFRFNNERRLLLRASQRIVFGWGRFGRSRIYDQRGKDISVTDGRWIITMGQYGLVGFLAEFGLIGLTVFRTTSTLRHVTEGRDSIFLAAVALILAITMIDMLPDASLTPLTWLFAGALLGRSNQLRRMARQTHPFVQSIEIDRNVHIVGVEQGNAIPLDHPRSRPWLRN
jgi:hypothetical protein